MSTSGKPISARSVADTFESYEPEVRRGLMALRDLILATADETESVGPIEETLKWGQPSYLTTKTGSGSTIRIAPTSADSSFDYAMFVICHTNLIDQFKDLFGDALDYDGDRALLFKVGETVPVDEIRACVAMALTYHLRKPK